METVLGFGRVCTDQLQPEYNVKNKEEVDLIKCKDSKVNLTYKLYLRPWFEL